MPTDKGKAFLWGAGVFAGVTAVAALVLKLLNMLESGTLLMAGLAGLFVALGVVFTLIGQLKQAAVQAGASGYARDGGLQLQAKFDCHLYTKTNRKKIETQKQSASA